MTQNIDDKIDALNGRELTDDEIETLTTYDAPGWAGGHDRSVAPVVYEGGEISLGEPRTVDATHQPRWDDSVLGTVGAGVSTPSEAREMWSEARTRFIASLTEQKRMQNAESW